MEKDMTETENGRQGQQVRYKLLLFVNGETAGSERALRNIRQICQEHLNQCCDLQLIDVRQNPDKVRKYGILAVPALLKLSPPPERRVVGDLSEKEKTLSALDIYPEE
ncbi:MAG: circadian clock KaiB family protein [Desulfobacterales bacterium]|nr:circadian clock KaiB family protein [Desulfobacterales bacterium]